MYPIPCARNHARPERSTVTLARGSHGTAFARSSQCCECLTVCITSNVDGCLSTPPTCSFHRKLCFSVVSRSVSPKTSQTKRYYYAGSVTNSTRKVFPSLLCIDPIEANSHSPCYAANTHRLSILPRSSTWPDIFPYDHTTFVLSHAATPPSGPPPTATMSLSDDSSRDFRLWYGTALLLSAACGARRSAAERAKGR
jgi:hypothetical protein